MGCGCKKKKPVAKPQIVTLRVQILKQTIQTGVTN